MEVLMFKTAAILLIFVAGVAGGLLPVKIGVSEQKYLSLGNAFAGGIFLGAGLIHMLSDANEKFQSLAGSVDYPLGILLCGCGFILILFLEKVMIRGEAERSMSDERPVYPVVLFLVLSVHSIIVGISLGLEKTLISSVVIFIAVIAHKSSAAFALSVSLKNTGFPSRKIAETVASFSLMTPLGIVRGAIFSRMATSTGATKIEGVFDALAAGTFLYIATLDIIQEVFEKEEDRGLNFMLVIVSFGLMALIGIWT